MSPCDPYFSASWIAWFFRVIAALSLVIVSWSCSSQSCMKSSIVFPWGFRSHAFRLSSFCRCWILLSRFCSSAVMWLIRSAVSCVRLLGFAMVRSWGRLFGCLGIRLFGFVAICGCGC